MKRRSQPSRQESYLTKRQEKEQNQLRIFQLIWGGFITVGVAVMLKVLIDNPPALIGTIIVGFVLVLLGFLGVMCLLSAILSLVDQGLHTTKTKVWLISDKKIIQRRRVAPQYFLVVERGKTTHPSNTQRRGFWNLIRHARIIGVDADVYHQAVPGMAHQVIQGRWGNVIHKVIPLKHAGKQ